MHQFIILMQKLQVVHYHEVHGDILQPPQKEWHLRAMNTLRKPKTTEVSSFLGQTS